MNKEKYLEYDISMIKTLKAAWLICVCFVCMNLFFLVESIATPGAIAIPFIVVSLGLSIYLLISTDDHLFLVQLRLKEKVKKFNTDWMRYYDI